MEEICVLKTSNKQVSFLHPLRPNKKQTKHRSTTYNHHTLIHYYISFKNLTKPQPNMNNENLKFSIPSQKDLDVSTKEVLNSTLNHSKKKFHIKYE